MVPADKGKLLKASGGGEAMCCFCLDFNEDVVDDDKDVVDVEDVLPLFSVDDEGAGDTTLESNKSLMEPVTDSETLLSLFSNEESLVESIEGVLLDAEVVILPTPRLPFASLRFPAWL